MAVALVVLVGLGVLWEFSKLVFGFAHDNGSRAFWVLGGIVYVGLACFTLLMFSAPFFGMTPAILLIAGVIGTDVGAYFAARGVPLSDPPFLDRSPLQFAVSDPEGHLHVPRYTDKMV